jgi:hypothetical protein
MRRALVMAVILVSGPASAVEFPFSGIFGSPAACEAYSLGGKDAVLRGGTGEDGTALPIQIEEDDGFLLLEPSGLTTAGLSCTLAKLEGTRAEFDCSDGEPLSAVVIVRGNASVVFDAGDPRFFLRPCEAHALGVGKHPMRG